ncbi:cellulase family glycosylhydrolase [Caldibacillus lycopersici]|uniref:Exo-1,3-beta-glucanase D n=1 Tax=Perspicuibacillus lycopersici TaxID=1325689 RepID=A0AAE3IR65_9BACI|nr:chitobiase/beta-hexosaminidase C-terminal domain-containing protein [Perspicuibacillus lycopersici]MCU9612692.1 cellulase family glycosylhydrolase [Perspicuibacillus lycopersici]
MKKRVFPIFLSLLLIISLIPAPIHAEISEGDVLFQDFEGDSPIFSETANTRGTITSEDVFSGNNSLKYEVLASGDPNETAGSISIAAKDGAVDASAMKYLIFSINDTQGSNTIKVSLTDASGKSTSFGWQSPSTTKNTWVYYQIPLSNFSGIDLANVSEVRIGQWNSGVYYIDDIYFSTKNPPVPLVAPTATPSGEYEDYVVVEVKSQHSNFPIFYTTDGSTPDKSSTQYSGLLRFDNNTTLKAVVYNPDYDSYSDVSTYEYIVHTDSDSQKPMATPISGTYAEPQVVSLSTIVSDAKIYYTLDGSTPTVSSKEYTAPITISKHTTLKAITIKDGIQSDVSVFTYTISKKTTPFLKANGKTLRTNFGSGDEVVLRGTNAGGWLVMEQWMTPTDSPDLLTTINTLTDRFGEDAAWELLDVYQDHYWTKDDFDNLKAEGMNSVRLPFTYFDMLNEDGTLKESAFKRLDWFIKEASKRKLYVILDMHGAPGSQNGKDHSGDITYPDKGNLYGNEENMKKTIYLWTEIAKRYKDEKYVAGYDLLNEPGGASGIEQFTFYDQLYQAVRSVDTNHVLFIEAIWDPANLPNPELYHWENVAYSYHFYNWDNIDSFSSQKNFIDSKVKLVNAANYDVPLYVGEFTMFNNIQSWDYALKVFEEQGWSYSTWTYKATGNGTSWGLYTGEPERVNIYNDSFEVIKEKWSSISTTQAYTRNDYFADILRNYASPAMRESDERSLLANFEGLDANTEFVTGETVAASLDVTNKSAGEASVKLEITASSDTSENYFSLMAPDKKTFDLSDAKNSYPKYLMVDVYQQTGENQIATITVIDKNGNQSSGKTQANTTARSGEWSKIHVLLNSLTGDADMSKIVEIRIAFDDTGVYHLDNIFIGQSFANNVPDINKKGKH